MQIRRDSIVNLTLPKFSAHKNGTDQVDVPTGVWTKVTFTTEEYDIGSKYDAVNSKWIPGVVGQAHIDGMVKFRVLVDQSLIGISIFKNGIEYKSKLIGASGTDDQGADLSMDITVTAVEDYFEIYGRQDTGVNKDIRGLAVATFFMGHMLL